MPIPYTQQEDRATLRSIPGRAEQARTTYATALNAAWLMDRTQLGAFTVERAFTAAQNTIRTTLAAMRAEMEQATARARAWIDAQGAGDATSQLLSETRQQRGWERLRGQLDGGRPVTELIEETYKAGDFEALRALRAELPAFADARPDVTRLSMIGGSLPELLASIDRGLAELLPDDRNQRSAAVLRLEIDEAAELAEQAVTHAEKAAEYYTIEPALAASQSRPDMPPALRKAVRVIDVQESNAASMAG